jgi:hypothetical protein
MMMIVKEKRKKKKRRKRKKKMINLVMIQTKNLPIYRIKILKTK